MNQVEIPEWLFEEWGIAKDDLVRGLCNAAAQWGYRERGADISRRGHVTNGVRCISDEEAEAMVRMYQSGIGCVTIAAHFQYYWTSVRALLKRRGVTLRSSRAYPVEVRQKAIQLRGHGLTYAAISRQMKVSKSVVCDWCNS